MAVVVREIRPEDYERAGDIVVEAYRSLGVEGDEFYEPQLRDVPGRAATSQVLVAEDDGAVVGCVTFVDGLGELSEVDDPDAATIRMLGVTAAVRGRGVGALLMQECVDRARSSGRRRVRLGTRESMVDAHRLYRRMGFRRDPQHDWSPVPGMRLMSFVLELETP